MFGFEHTHLQGGTVGAVLAGCSFCCRHWLTGVSGSWTQVVQVRVTLTTVTAALCYLLQGGYAFAW